jgi:hypothetical protein
VIAEAATAADAEGLADAVGARVGGT